MRKGKKPQKNKQPSKSKDQIDNKDSGSEEEFEGQTQEKVELVPPVRRPPTAVGTGTPPPPPPEPRPSDPGPAPHHRPVLWRLLLAGGDRIKGSGVLCPWRGTDFAPHPCAGGRVARSLSAIR